MNERSFYKEISSEMRKFAYLKRFYERWNADSVFQSLHSDISEAAKEYDLNLASHELLYCLGQHECKNPEEEISLFVREYLDVKKKSWNFFTEFFKNKCIPENKVFKAWRARQNYRCAHTVGQYNVFLLHIPVAFELATGCSVGCWFCSLNAPPLKKIFEYTPVNQKLWLDCLCAVKKVIGDAAQTGFCYWATEPFDNPDYEKFCLDFYRVFGQFPPTTSAVAIRNPERTRSFLKLAEEHDCFSNRFSVLSLSDLHAIHAEFSAEELCCATLLLQNTESQSQFAPAGRARVMMQKYNQSEKEERTDTSSKLTECAEKINEAFSTNSCVSGFLINMSDCTVKLVSPCIATDAWPLGYITLAEGTFSDAETLENMMQKIIDTCMKTSIKHSDYPGFSGDFLYEPLDDGFMLTSQCAALKFIGNPLYKPVGKMIHENRCTAGEIAVKTADECSSHEANVFLILESLFGYGLLDEKFETKIL